MPTSQEKVLPERSDDGTMRIVCARETQGCRWKNLRHCCQTRHRRFDTSFPRNESAAQSKTYSIGYGFHGFNVWFTDKFIVQRMFNHPPCVPVIIVVGWTRNADRLRTFRTYNVGPADHRDVSCPARVCPTVGRRRTEQFRRDVRRFS